MRAACMIFVGGSRVPPLTLPRPPTMSKPPPCCAAVGVKPGSRAFCLVGAVAINARIPTPHDGRGCDARRTELKVA